MFSFFFLKFFLTCLCFIELWCMHHIVSVMIGCFIVFFTKNIWIIYSGIWKRIASIEPHLRSNFISIIKFSLIFLEMNLHLSTIVGYCGYNWLTIIIITIKTITSVWFEVCFDRNEPNFLQKSKKIYKKFE